MKEFISKRWFSTVWRSVLTRMYPYIIFAPKIRNPLTRRVSRIRRVSFCPIPSAHIFASKK